MDKVVVRNASGVVVALLKLAEDSPTGPLDGLQRTLDDEMPGSGLVVTDAVPEEIRAFELLLRLRRVN